MPTNRIWTIGHSTRTADVFLELLQAHNIDRLADIRTVPKSRRHPHFTSESLSTLLSSKEIAYRHFPTLGGLRKPQPDSANSGWRHPAFRGYADHMLTREFRIAVDELLQFADGARAAVMCAEAVWWRCHRMLLSDALTARGVAVEHILTAAQPQPHRMTPFARVRDDGQVWYPGLLESPVG